MSKKSKRGRPSHLYNGKSIKEWSNKLDMSINTLYARWKRHGRFFVGRETVQKEYLAEETYTHNGVTLTARLWAERLNVNLGTFKRRVKIGTNPFLTRQEAKRERVKKMMATRRVRKYSYHGKRMNLHEWAEYLNIPYMTIMKRVNRYGIKDKSKIFDADDQRCHYFEINGERKSIEQFATELGISRGTMLSRISSKSQDLMGEANLAESIRYYRNKYKRTWTHYARIFVWNGVSDSISGWARRMNKHAPSMHKRLSTWGITNPLAFQNEPITHRHKQQFLRVCLRSDNLTKATEKTAENIVKKGKIAVISADRQQMEVAMADGDKLFLCCFQSIESKKNCSIFNAHWVFDGYFYLEQPLSRVEIST
jgi:hypothetical protein